MKKKIVVSDEVRDRLLTEFSVDGKPMQKQTLYRYLRFEGKSYAAVKARELALELGGRVIEERDVTEGAEL